MSTEMRISSEQAALLAIALADLLDAIERTIRADPMMDGQLHIKTCSQTAYNKKVRPAMLQATELLNHIGYGDWAAGEGTKR